jgi:hypothetical protein
MEYRTQDKLRRPGKLKIRSLPCRRFAKEKLQAQTDTGIEFVVVLFIERNQGYDFVVKPVMFGPLSIELADNRKIF